MRGRLAASEPGSAVELLGRIGITTGEVLVAGPDQPLIGDAMNTAARLQSAAEPGEILIGDPTYRLVKDAVLAEPVEPLVLKGKDEPVAAFRVMQVASLSPIRTRRLDAPMVGRLRERALLEQAFERTVSDRACQLFTVLGSAGAGKSRLVEEFLSGLDGADVMRGRCLAYGEGITYFPIAEAMKDALGLADFDDESSVREAIHAAVAEEDHADAITANLAKLLGAGEGGAPEETFWAIRRFLEVHGGDRPLVVVFDDIHWGESTFLDLIEHVADWSRDASVLLLCMARPDLLDVRPTWAGGKTNATTISLAPLTEPECAELIDHLLGSSGLPAAVRDRIAGVAEGNPLFVEEMLRMLIDDGLLTSDGDGWVPAGGLAEVAVPPTISALLSARLDRLSDEERTVIERAAVCGKEFHRGAIIELLEEPDRASVDVHLRSLVRKELVGPERSLLPGEDAYRFRHLLIRDAAYDAIPKARRASMHEGFAHWIERIAGERVAEQEEIVGYHLERAFRLRAELGPPDDRALELRRAAAEHLATAGGRSYERGDTAGAIKLMTLAVDLADPGTPDWVRHGLELGRMLAWGGREVEAIEFLARVEEAAAALGDPVVQMHASLASMDIRAWREPQGWMMWRPAVERAIEVFERAGDQLGLARAWYLIVWDYTIRAMFGESLQAAERALGYAVAAGDRRLELELLATHIGDVWGALPVEQGLQMCERVIARAAGNRALEADARTSQAVLVAMRGELHKARRLYAESKAIIDDLGRPLTSAFVMQGGWYIEMLGRDFRRAEDLTRTEYQRLLDADARALLDITGDMLALALCAQGRFDDADEVASRSERRGYHPDDVVAQSVWRRVRARRLSARGEHQEAVRLAREAEAPFADTDALNDHGETLLDLAEVLRAAGNVEDAVTAASRALALYEQKENIVETGRARAFLTELER